MRRTAVERVRGAFGRVGERVSDIDSRPMARVLDRLQRMLWLDTSVFQEVRDDERELKSALIVAGSACLLAGLGAWLHWEVADATPANAFLNAFVLGSLFLALTYGAATLLIYVLMVQFFRAQVDLLAIVRAMGYAAAPLGLSVGMFIPVLYPVFALMPLALLLVAMIYAVQEATGVKPVQVVAACLMSFGFMTLVLGVVAISSSAPEAPIGAGQFGLFYNY